MTSTEQREAGNEGSHEEHRASGMSRYIWCRICVDEFEAELGIYEDEPPEFRPKVGHTTIRFGILASPGHVCDRCNQPLPDGKLAAGVTFSESREHYRPWEEEFFYVEGYATRPARGRQKEKKSAGSMTSTEQGGVPRVKVEPRRPVRMHFEPQAIADADEACHFVGRFRRKAREQGWTEEAIEWASRCVTASRAVEQLGPHIEPAGPEPLTWRTQLERTFDYVEGARALDHDQDADFRPLRFLVRGFRLALRAGNDFGNGVYRGDASEEDAKFWQGGSVGSDERGGVSTDKDDATSRFIVCPTCHQLAGPKNDGDVVRHGLVIAPGTSCTTCHKPLPLGSSATAITFYGDPRHYQPWEHQHLRLYSEPPRRPSLLRPLASCSRLFSRLRLALSQMHHTRPS